LLKQGDPDGNYWMPAMSDAPLRGYNGRHEWFWEPGDEEAIFPLQNLMNMYYKSVGHNSTLIMGLTPDPNGLIPEPDVKRLKEWGDEIKSRFQKPLASTHGEGQVFELLLDKDTKVNHVILQEAISKGERVRNYKIEAFIKGHWREVGLGECIGQKRIQIIETVEASKIRLKILESRAKPILKNFSVYYIN
jgi:alpha-L-fucosidase